MCGNLMLFVKDYMKLTLLRLQFFHVIDAKLETNKTLHKNII